MRLFREHEKRRVSALSGLWDFRAADGKAGKMFVPGCWENIPDFAHYRGCMTFSKRVSGGGNLRFSFGGISHTARVFLDGALLGSHYNAYTPFSVLASDVQAGEHTLQIEVDNSYGPSSALHFPNDYMTYGGITRDADMEWLADAFIERVHFTPRLVSGQWQAKIEVTVTSLCEQVRSLRLALSLAGETKMLEMQLPPMQSVSVSAWVDFPNAEAYSPSSPKLYDLTARLFAGENEIDDLIDRVGFREISVRGRDILINGEKLIVRGFNRHEDSALFGCAAVPQLMYQDLLLMKDAGANAVRTSHYPNDARFLDMCDELGMLVWEESHARGVGEKAMASETFQTQSQTCVREMVVAHYNHPSIIVWGVLNECAADTEIGRAEYAREFSLLRALDPTRPVTAATNKLTGDLTLDLCDIASFNLYPGWYEDVDAETMFANAASLTDKPFWISETGAGGIYGYRSQGAEKWSEQRQAQILTRQLEAVFNEARASGVFVWQFCDCRVDESLFFARPRSMNNKGVVDEYRRPKLAYEAVSAVFQSRKGASL